jgi:hypothetical protein
MKLKKIQISISIDLFDKLESIPKSYQQYFVSNLLLKELAKNEIKSLTIELNIFNKEHKKLSLELVPVVESKLNNIPTQYKNEYIVGVIQRAVDKGELEKFKKECGLIEQNEG